MDIAFESAFAQPVLDVVRRLGKGNRVRSDTLRKRLCEKTGLLPLEVEEGIRELHRRGLLLFQANARGQPVSGYVEFIRETKAISTEETFWSTSLMSKGFDSITIELLSPLATRLAAMTPEDIQVLAECFAMLRDSCDLATLNQPGPNVSARTFMGSAKVISRIPPKAMAALGLNSRLQNPSPRYLLHAGPDQDVLPTAALLIENPQAFENAVTAGLAQKMSLICTFGFALSYVGEITQGEADYQGRNEPIVLQRCGHKRSVTELFNMDHLYFWGDLDIGALKIYLACRQATPRLQLSGIYKAMEMLISDPAQSHPYADIFDKEGQARMFAFPDQVIGIEPAVRSLFKRCAYRGVDQEIVKSEDIARFGETPYLSEVCK